MQRAVLGNEVRMNYKTVNVLISPFFLTGQTLPPILRFKKYGDIKTYIAIIKFPTFMPALANGGAWFG